MAIFTDGLRLEAADRPVTDFPASLGVSLGASAAESLADSPTAQLFGIGELEKAAGYGYSRISGEDPAYAFGGTPAIDAPRQVPAIGRPEAEERVKAAGLAGHITLPNQDTIASPVVDIMIARARERREREATLQRGPQGVLATSATVGTSFLVGAIDPLNIAASFIPVMGELRYGKLLASAGESFAGRTAVRGGVGAASGVVGQGVLEPLDWYAHTQDGRDFGMSDVLHNLVFGAALGGGLHGAGGAIADVYRSRKGRPLYPYDIGEPMEYHTPWDELRRQPQPPPIPRDILGEFRGTHVPERALAEEGVPAHELPDHLNPEFVPEATRPTPALQILQDLPPRAKEDSMRAAIAAIVNDEPVKVGEMLQTAAQTDPRIAESFEAFHGSPHDFDRFDMSKLGTGEGAQSYGHGLYFAENEKVARQYQRQTADKAFVNKVAELYDEGFSPDDAWAEIKDNWKDFTPAEQRLMTALEKDDWLGFDYPHQAVNAVLRDIKRFDVSPETEAAAHAVGNMYRVKIKADPEHFLDWDKPFSEQSDHVRKALAGTAEPHHRGQEIYSAALRDAGYEPADALKALSDAGIPGLKYLDQGSRGGMRTAGSEVSEWTAAVEKARAELLTAEQSGSASQRDLAQLRDEVKRTENGLSIVQARVEGSTRNFVVFDDKHIEITHKNGEPVKRAGDVVDLTYSPDATKVDALARSFLHMARGDVEKALREFDEYRATRPDSEGKFAQEVRAAIEAGLPGSKPAPVLGDLNPAKAVSAKGGASIPGAVEPPKAANANQPELPARALGAEPRQWPAPPEGAQVVRHGDHGPEVEGLQGRWREAVDWLSQAQSGDARGVLTHPDVPGGHIDVVWGNKDYGLEHIIALHPEVVPDLPERIAGMKLQRVTQAGRPGERLVLAAPDGSATAIVRTGYDGEKKIWLLTAYTPESDTRGSSGPGGRGGGTTGSPSEGPARSPVSPEANVTPESGPRNVSEADWQDLAHRSDESNQLEASRAADNLPEPIATRLDDRVAAADKADAYARQLYDMFKERLPEKDRQRLEDTIKTLEEEHAIDREVLERSGACLFGARA